jgi:hypothetical protein
MVRRGLKPAAGALRPLISRAAVGSRHRPLLKRSTTSSLTLAAGQSTDQLVSTSITSPVQGVLAAMFVNKLKSTALALFAAVLVFIGAGVMARQDTKPISEPPSTALNAVVDTGDLKVAVRTDESSAPGFNGLAEAKSGNLGSQDLHRMLVSAAQAAYRAKMEAFRGGNASAEEVYQASRRWMDATNEQAGFPTEKAAAAAAHLDRVRGMARAGAGTGGSPKTTAELAMVKAYAAEAELWLSQAKTNRPEPGQTPSVGDGPGKDPRSRLIRSKLDEPVVMSFPNETPLDNVLKYIQSSTKSPEMPKGIPVYVDPIGLQESEKSLTSSVRIDLDGVPLRRTLQLVLKQLGLSYHVEDGMIFITSEVSEDRPLGPAINDPRPILVKAAKAARGELSVKEMEELIGQFKAREQVRRLAAGTADGGQSETSPTYSLQDKAARAERGELSVKELEELIAQFKAREQVSRLAAANAAIVAASDPDAPSVPSEDSVLQEKAAKIERGQLRIENLGMKEMEDLTGLFKAREQVRRLAHPNSEPSRGDSLQPKTAEPPASSQEQMKLLLKDLRELIDVMKADRQGKITPAQPQQLHPGETGRDLKRIQ